MNANKFAQSHAKKFNRSENNPLSFGGATFLKHPVHNKVQNVSSH